jgi:hypothetical protein
MPRRRPLRLGWIDFLVVAAATLTFSAAVAFSNHHSSELPGGPSVQAMADQVGAPDDDLPVARKPHLPPLLLFAAPFGGFMAPDDSPTGF